MNIFIIGATGYIGGSLAMRFIAQGHHVVGLVRDDDKAARLATFGIEPIKGDLAALEIIGAAAHRADVIVNAANADDSVMIFALLDTLAGTGKIYVHTSGTSVVADRAAGEYSTAVFTEDTPFEPLPERHLRVAIDRQVLLAAQRRVGSVVMRPSLIYGRGRGLNPDSLQLPTLIKVARQFGVPRHVGRGLNVWSHVHIDDVVEAYVLAIADAPAGSLFYLENGETSWRDMAQEVGQALGLGRETREWPLSEAVRTLGAGAITSYGSNSRVRSYKARKMLGWQPSGPDLFQVIRRTSAAS